MITEEVIYSYDETYPTEYNLSKPITDFDMLRFYCGFAADGIQVYEIPTWRFLTNNDIMNIHLMYVGGGTIGAVGSLRFYIMRKGTTASTSTTQINFYRVKLTYLNDGTSQYTNNTNGAAWAKSPIRKIVGVKFNG
jgi:hypothetical protein